MAIFCSEGGKLILLQRYQINDDKSDNNEDKVYVLPKI